MERRLGKKYLSLAIVILILVVVSVFMVINRGVPEQILGISDRVTVLRQSGEIHYRESGQDMFIPINETQKSISKDSSVKTFDAVGYLLFEQNSFHTLQPNSEIDVIDVEEGVHLFQRIGSVFHSFNPDNGFTQNEYQVETPDISASVRGTSFQINVVRNSDGTYTTTMFVFEGEVEVLILATGELFSVSAGQALSQYSTGDYVVTYYSVPDIFPEGVSDLVDEVYQNSYIFNSNIVQLLLAFDWFRVQSTVLDNSIQNVESEESDPNDNPGVAQIGTIQSVLISTSDDVPNGPVVVQEGYVEIPVPEQLVPSYEDHPGNHLWIECAFSQFDLSNCDYSTECSLVGVSGEFCFPFDDPCLLNEEELEFSECFYYNE